MSSFYRTAHQLRVRLTPTPESRLGICLAFLTERNYNIAREIELLLEARFLPLALKHRQEDDMGWLMAYESLGKLEGMMHTIQLLYKMKDSQRNTLTPQISPGPATANVLSSEQIEADLENEEMEENAQTVTNAFLFGSSPL
jgi:hypothetical protein